MAQAVRYSRFGGPDVLEVVDIEPGAPGPGEVLVAVAASGLNPIESVRRRGERGGLGAENTPVGQGTDLAGTVMKVGPETVGFRVGDSVMGYVESGAHATHVVVPVTQLMQKPSHITWEVAGGLYTAGTTAWEAVRSANVGPGDTVVVTAAAGGLGCLAAQLAIHAGATVVGTAVEARFDFLRQFGIVPVHYGSALATRIREVTPGGVAAFLDFYGGQAGVGVELGVDPRRIVTTLDLGDVERYGVQLARPSDIATLEKVARKLEHRQLRLPIADIFPIDRVVDAYEALDRRDAPGKIVLGMSLVEYRNQRVEQVELKEQEATLGTVQRHPHVDVNTAVPPAIGDGSVRRRRRDAREQTESQAAELRQPE